MIYHILFALLLVFYFEITGQYILYRLGKNNLPLAFPIGLMALMCYGYITTSIYTHLNGKFIVVLGVYALYFLLSVIFILKDFKKINWHFDYKNILVAFIFVGIMTYYAYNTTLGDTKGFDSLYYLNLISMNVGADTLNSKDIYYGGAGGFWSLMYDFQSYYYFVSCFVFVVKKVLNLFTDANNLSIIVWVFQILYNFFLVSIILNGADKICKDKKLLKYTILFIFLFFYGKTYFNNVFGFYGNTYRTISIAYAILYLTEIIREHKKEDFILLGICINAACAFSSSATYIIVFLMFGAYFVLVDKEDNLFRYYSLILIFPLINLFISGLRKQLVVGIIYVLVICALLFIFNKQLTKLSRIKYIKLILLIGATLVMVYLSFSVTHNLLDFSAFFDNISESADMTIDYFNNYQVYGINESYYRFLVLALLAYACIFEFKDPLVMSFIILIIVLFNPFCCAYLNYRVPVYYRAYEIIINPFTIIYFMNLLFTRLNNKYIYYISLATILIMFGVNVDYLKPMYYHKSFVPGDDYNGLMKMDNDEYDVLVKLLDFVKYNYSLDKEDPIIVTSNSLSIPIYPSAHFYYGRNNWPKSAGGDENAAMQVYAIFYPSEYLGDEFPYATADYTNVETYLKKAKIDYLVVDKDKIYYNEESGLYEYLYFKISGLDYGYKAYENDSYVLYVYK